MPAPHTFLAKAENSARVPKRLRNLFEPRVAAVAGAKAAPGSQRIPFLVMCGTLDPRLPIAKAFVARLEALGYQVEVEWPRTPHLCGAPCPPEQQMEFQRFSRRPSSLFGVSAVESDAAICAAIGGSGAMPLFASWRVRQSGAAVALVLVAGMTAGCSVALMAPTVVEGRAFPVEHARHGSTRQCRKRKSRHLSEYRCDAPVARP